jgi:hypothetical protein
MMSSKTKTIRYRGGIVHFQLPANWREEYDPQGGGTFYEDRPDSGTLRLHVLTAESKTGEPCDQAIEHSFPAGSSELLASGLRMRYRLVTSEERGTAIHLHRWEIAVPVPPNRFRIICFTHTVLARQESTRRLLRSWSSSAKPFRTRSFREKAGSLETIITSHPHKNPDDPAPSETPRVESLKR